MPRKYAATANTFANAFVDNQAVISRFRRNLGDMLGLVGHRYAARTLNTRDAKSRLIPVLGTEESTACVPSSKILFYSWRRQTPSLHPPLTNPLIEGLAGGSSGSDYPRRTI